MASELLFFYFSLVQLDQYRESKRSENQCSVFSHSPFWLCFPHFQLENSSADLHDRLLRCSQNDIHTPSEIYIGMTTHSTGLVSSELGVIDNRSCSLCIILHRSLCPPIRARP